MYSKFRYNLELQNNVKGMRCESKLTNMKITQNGSQSEEETQTLNMNFIFLLEKESKCWLLTLASPPS